MVKFKKYFCNSEEYTAPNVDIRNQWKSDIDFGLSKF